MTSIEDTVVIEADTFGPPGPYSLVYLHREVRCSCCGVVVVVVVVVVADVATAQGHDGQF